MKIIKNIYGSTRKYNFLVRFCSKCMHITKITLYTAGWRCIASSWKNLDSREGSYNPWTNCVKCLNRSTLFLASIFSTNEHIFEFPTRSSSSNCIWTPSTFLFSLFLSTLPLFFSLNFKLNWYPHYSLSFLVEGLNPLCILLVHFHPCFHLHKNFMKHYY